MISRSKSEIRISKSLAPFGLSSGSKTDLVYRLNSFLWVHRARAGRNKSLAQTWPADETAYSNDVAPGQAEIQMLKCSKLYFALCAIIEFFEFVLNFVFWSFDIVSNFVLRISNLACCLCEI